MKRKLVTCPKCDLEFVSARRETFCPGCHQLIEPVVRTGR